MAGEGHYNDMDMLEVGRGLTQTEEEVHFGMWCIMSSPLLVGCDMTTIPESSLALLKNKELIALNQDHLGLQAYVVQREKDCYVLVKDIERKRGKVRAVAFYNASDSAYEFRTPLRVLELGVLAPAVSTILRLAFTPGAAAGGLVGQGLMAAMRFGVARGLFSNESGMGSAPLVASAAQTRNPVRQALVSATGTFWDTVVVCLMTGLVLVTTIMKNPAIDMAQISDGGQLTTLAFAQIPVLGPVILVVGIITFAWSTILGWSYYGERCAQYLWGKRALLPYKLVFVAVVVVGPVLALDLVWTIADILNALMAIPNLVAVLLLSGVVARETRHYLGNLDEVDQTEIPRVDK